MDTMHRTTPHLLVIAALGTLVSPIVAFAEDSAPATYELMAPLMGDLTGKVDLSTYLAGAVQVIIGLAGILAGTSSRCRPAPVARRATGCSGAPTW